MKIYGLERRRVVQGMVAAGALYRTGLLAQTPSAAARWVLLGTGTGEGIYRARWNNQTGVIEAPELAVATSQPTYLVLHPHLPVVYACNEGAGAGAAVSAFALDRAGAKLMPLGKQATHGDAPCFVSVDSTGQLLLTANYTGGSLSAFPLDREGKPGPAIRVFSCEGSPLCGTPGPVHDRQEGPHLHCAILSPDSRFVLACDLGDDAILVFPIAPGTAKPLLDPIRVPARAGSGPRHLAFHPDGRRLYCIHELDATVDLYSWQMHAGHPQLELVPDSIASIRPSSTAQPGAPVTGAEIALTRDGRFLYTSTRGVDLLTVFRIEPATGKLTQLQQLPCGGKMPRFFALDPTERFLLCAHQEGKSVTTFTRDRTSGELAGTVTVPVANPQCILWL